MGNGNERRLLAGVAKAEITPSPTMLNWVGADRSYDGVLDPLFARALVLSDGQTEAAFVTWDLIDSGEEAVDRVRQAVQTAVGIPQEHVIVTATHTHSAPRAPFTRPAENLLMFGPTEKVEGMRRVMEDPTFRSWGESLPESICNVVKSAKADARPVELAIGRADAGEWLFNRRPIAPDGSCTTMLMPKDPKSLPDGLRFGPLDPTLTTLQLCEPNGESVVTLFTVPCHPVSIYPHHKGVSADWPGRACEHVVDALGGEAMFLSGCSGEIVPARRGVEARDQMARFFADRAIRAASQHFALGAAPLRIGHSLVALPLSAETRQHVGKDTWSVDVHAVVCGDLAIVTLPGEPLNGLAREIQSRSPYPHTLVIGYTNGWGVGYVGLPGEKARGGYEARAGRGADECGAFLIETGVRLLCELSDSGRDQLAV